MGKVFTFDGKERIKTAEMYLLYKKIKYNVSRSQPETDVFSVF